MNRKKFIQLSAGLAGVSGYLASCSPPPIIKGSIIGASASIGHLLRDKTFPPPTETTHKKVVIIGGGVSGLSAARHLRRQGIEDFILFDLEKEAGGNAAHGQNDVSAYPWGAHYVPTPNNDLTEYLAFLQECNVVTGLSDKGLPVYNELYLCFDPQERLYINGRWQDGLVPHFGVPTDQVRQIDRFFKQIDEYRSAKGADGKDAFAIPVDQSSKDEAFTRLDTLSMKEWLLANGYDSAYLHWYINYCTRDDFGTPHHLASAWIGIHYFAARKGMGANASHSDTLTWPEGNGFLVKQLQQNIQQQVNTQNLAIKIEPLANGVRVEYIDIKTHTCKAVEAEQCIVAVPQFVAARLLGDEERLKKIHAHLNYAPWMVANIRVEKMEERSGAPLSWDNVLYESDSLGFVEATHQLLQQSMPVKNLTYYLPLTTKTPAEERTLAQQRSHAAWTDIIINDLRKVYPGIREKVTEINVMLWGHAMAQPLKGMIHGPVRKELAASIDNKIHFAHTDLAGISIFEEAFYQGLEAAKKVMARLSYHQ